MTRQGSMYVNLLLYQNHIDMTNVTSNTTNNDSNNQCDITTAAVTGDVLSLELVVRVFTGRNAFEARLDAGTSPPSTHSSADKHDI